jgi:chemotaxis protein CheX
MELRLDNGRLELELPTVLDLPVAAELRDLLIDAAARDTAADLVLFGAGVERVSTASIQVLLAGALALRGAARRLELDHPSEALTSAFHHLGLEAEFQTLTAA